MYRIFKDRYPHVKMNETKFCKIMHTFFRITRDNLVKGSFFNLRNQVGMFIVYKYHKDSNTKNASGNLNSKRILDYKLSQEKKKTCTPEQIANKEYYVYATGLTYYKLAWRRWSRDKHIDRSYLTSRQRRTRFYTLKVAKDLKLMLGNLDNMKLVYER